MGAPMSQGPGWWQASDGRWYPPEQHPGVSGPPGPGGAPFTVKKRMHPALIVLLVLVGVVAAIAVLGVVAGVVVFATGGSGDAADAAACRVEQRAMLVAVEAARQTVDPSDAAADFLQDGGRDRYWTIEGDEVVPLGDLPEGCP